MPIFFFHSFPPVLARVLQQYLPRFLNCFKGPVFPELNATSSRGAVPAHTPSLGKKENAIRYLRPLFWFSVLLLRFGFPFRPALSCRVLLVTFRTPEPSPA